MSPKMDQRGIPQSISLAPLDPRKVLADLMKVPPAPDKKRRGVKGEAERPKDGG